MHHEDHDMSRASQYHTRKCMLISVPVTFHFRSVCNHLSQEFPTGKNKIVQNLITEDRRIIDDYGKHQSHVREH